PEDQHMEDSVDQRLPNNRLALLLLLLYSPVGLCLMLMRLFIGVHVFLVSCALPDSFIRRFVVRIMCSVLGMHVRQRRPQMRDGSVKLYICNHVTQFDHNVINLLTSCSTPMLEDSAGFVCWARGFMELGAETRARAELSDALRRYSSSPGAPPLLLFPEEDTTNGRAGLLKFSSWPFSLTDCVQPVTLLVKRPFLAVTTPESSWLAELLWTFFVPFTVYQVRWLPPVSRRDGDSLQDFAGRVQQLLAIDLGVVSTNITRADKAEHIKRKRHTAAPTAALSFGARQRTANVGFVAPGPVTEDPKIVRMAQQVKDVLPAVPLGVITRDLMKTNCVDTTITNLLESTEEYPPEVTGGSTSGAARQQHPSSSSSFSSTAAISTVKPAAKMFGKSPCERHMSLQERKEALYEYARRRYIEQHGLDPEDDM
uniref:Lipid droplet-regulating VLDL assembly factor AUP1 n=1 Tax=Denticeps clupeoides TaxID=299321 RepID=A0AAY4CPT0_9TELE